jgi:hypothetical protein
LGEEEDGVFNVPQERNVRIPFFVGLFMVALGFFFFETYGTFLGFCEDGIVAWQLQEIKAHPEVRQTVEREAATPEQAADKAWERIKFFHGHGYLMVLASFVFLVLMANAPTVPTRIRGTLMWVSLLAMVLYNLGWGLSGWLVPFMGAEQAKELSEWIFFGPFGLVIVAITGYLAIVYGRQVRTAIQRPSGV